MDERADADYGTLLGADADARLDDEDRDEPVAPDGTPQQAAVNPGIALRLLADDPTD